MKPVAHHDLTNSVQDFRLLDDYEAALRDLLHFYDRVREPPATAKAGPPPTSFAWKKSANWLRLS